jgi:hypothetical protein
MTMKDGTKGAAFLYLFVLAVLAFVGRSAADASGFNNYWSHYGKQLSVPLLTATRTVTPTPQPTATALPWLSTSNGRIVRSDNGQGVELRGVNVLRNEWVYPDMTFERTAIPYLASQWHANLITHGFASGPVAAGDTQYLAVLDEYVDLATQNGMYIILCYYYPTLNGDQPPYPGVDPNYIAAMTTLVQRYHTRPNVLFMLQAEPHSDWYPDFGQPGSQSYRVTWNGTDTNGYDHAVQLRPYYDSVITQLRAVDNPAPYEHLILASGDGYGRDISPVVVDEYGHGGPDPIQHSDNFVYSSHPYDTRAGSNDWDYALPVARAGYPVLVTEFGTGGQMAQSDTNALMSEMASLHISWTAWVMDSEGCPCLLSSRDPITAISPYGTSVRDRIISEANLGTTCFNGDMFNRLRASYGHSLGEPGYDVTMDFDHDGDVDARDYTALLRNYGRC